MLYSYALNQIIKNNDISELYSQRMIFYRHSQCFCYPVSITHSKSITILWIFISLCHFTFEHINTHRNGILSLPYFVTYLLSSCYQSPLVTLVKNLQKQKWQHFLHRPAKETISPIGNIWVFFQKFSLILQFKKKWREKFKFASRNYFAMACFLCTALWHYLKLLSIRGCWAMVLAAPGKNSFEVAEIQWSW